MSELAFPNISEIEASAVLPQENKGTIETPSGSHEVFAYQDTAAASKDAFQFLTEANEPNGKPDEIQFEAEWLTPEKIELEDTTLEMQQFLDGLAPTKDAAFESHAASKSRSSSPKALNQTTQSTSSQTSDLANHSNLVLKPYASSLPLAKANTEKTYPSLFSLARAMNQKEKPDSQETLPRPRVERHDDPYRIPPKPFEIKEKSFEPAPRYQPEHEKGKEREGKGHQGNQQGDEGGESKKGRKGPARAVRRISGAGSSSPARSPSPTQPPLTIGNVFIRYMELMARILGQAEAEAHQLYLTIKQRTDHVDEMNQLIGKVNSTPGAINWSQDEEMKQLVDRIRSLGVDIPEGKYQWNEEEKRLLKENIQMQKDGLEKITQLERTDMQRFLQETSQCHQARSNVLKMLKEVIDTIIYNMRP